MILKDDPRLGPALKTVLKKFGLDGEALDPAVKLTDSKETKLAYLSATEPLYQALSDIVFKPLASPKNIKEETQIIKGEDENNITLYISRPKTATQSLPAVLHLHGGGMSLLAAADPNYVHWRQNLAAKGLIVIGVEFRNIAGVNGNYAFPAGLNDCYSALKWLYQQKKALGISNIIVSGESGGGNLTLATTLKAKKDNALHLIDGVFAQCPYISNHYGNPVESNLYSLIENDKYLINNASMNIMAALYDGVSSKNPLAWPYHATQEDLSDLPPHVIYVNELDPLRDEGIVYHNKLEKAKVKSDLTILKGTVHSAEGLFPEQLPKIHQQVQEDIKHFAENVNSRFSV